MQNPTQQEIDNLLIIFPSNSIATVGAMLIIFISLFCVSRLKRKKKSVPKAGGAWPIIGHLHLLRGPQPPHRILGDMADKYSPIFALKLGVNRSILVSNWEMVKECQTTNDRVFATRPHTVAMDVLAYDRSMFGFSPYGNYWRHVRKISTLELLSNNRLQMFRHVRESELEKASKELYKLWKTNSDENDKVLVEMKRWFGDISLNMIVRIIYGKSVGYVTTNEGQQSDEGWKQALKDFFDLSGRFLAADALPLLRWMDIGGYEKAMKKTAKEMDISKWLKEHRKIIR